MPKAPIKHFIYLFSFCNTCQWYCVSFVKVLRTIKPYLSITDFYSSHCILWYECYKIPWYIGVHISWHKQNFSVTGFYSNSEGSIHMYSNTQCSAKYSIIWNKRGPTFTNFWKMMPTLMWKWIKILMDLKKEQSRIWKKTFGILHHLQL